MGGWPDGVDLIIKKLTEEALDERLVKIMERLKKSDTLASIAKAMCLEQSQVQNIYYRSKHSDVVNYRAKKKLERVQLKEEQQQKKDRKKEAADTRVVAILERVKKGEKFPEIAKAMCLEQSHANNLYYKSQHSDVVDYRAKEELKRVQLKEEQQQKKDRKKKESRKRKAAGDNNVKTNEKGDRKSGNN